MKLIFALCTLPVLTAAMLLPSWHNSSAGSLDPRQGCADTVCNCRGIRAGKFCGDGAFGCELGIVYQCSDEPDNPHICGDGTPMEGDQFSAPLFLCTLPALAAGMLLPSRGQARHNATGELNPRACVATTCDCRGVPPGLFCGDGAFGCSQGDVFQCGVDPGNVCTYGVRISCTGCTTVFCED
ncbi:hypothetical protein AURDEDRAFT_170555 [Auricularia subglabra TFB-10046 SS5]|nr:hypothetical protein AURDEDRAFT_170555 [Auricularia subglabra TFB-10046 SS5]